MFYIIPEFKSDSISSNIDLSDKLVHILYEKLIDLSSFRYDLYTHRLITTSILLSKEYNWSDVFHYIESDKKLKEIYNYMQDVFKVSNKIENIEDHKIAVMYDDWHGESRYFTDNLNEDMQPKFILDRLLKMYDNFVNENEYPKHNLFSSDRNIFIEDYR